MTALESSIVTSRLMFQWDQMGMRATSASVPTVQCMQNCNNKRKKIMRGDGIRKLPGDVTKEQKISSKKRDDDLNREPGSGNRETVHTHTDTRTCAFSGRDG